MAKKTRRPPARRPRQAPELLTLTDLARRAGISPATAHRYQKEHGDLLPSRGEGRTRRYLPSAVEVLRGLFTKKRRERGVGAPPRGPRKAAAGRRPGSAPRSARQATPGRVRAKAGLLSLRKIAQMTGIAYPTLLRYVARHGQGIPQQGTGRKRRFPPEAVPVFVALRQHRGRLPRGEEVAARGRKGGDPQLVRRLQALEEAHAELTRKLRRLQRMLDRPWRVTLSRSR
ncbi:MAG: MerR family transcriptional regulator [Holophagales bacterium]|nr:MAG: MerR family transcriptional regulator [Holophagales bacterium]